jgi:hypothetical protein
VRDEPLGKGPALRGVIMVGSAEHVTTLRRVAIFERPRSGPIQRLDGDEGVSSSGAGAHGSNAIEPASRSPRMPEGWRSMVKSRGSHGTRRPAAGLAFEGTLSARGTPREARRPAMKPSQPSEGALEFRRRRAQRQAETVHLPYQLTEPAPLSAEFARPWFNTLTAARSLDKPTRAAFSAWAKRQGVVPVRRAGLVLYAKADIDRVLGLLGRSRTGGVTIRCPPIVNHARPVGRDRKEAGVQDAGIAALRAEVATLRSEVTSLRAAISARNQAAAGSK